jgi:hypothetical protein
MYLKEEIQAESLVRSLPGFARCLPVAVVFHGQVLSVAGLARDAGMARTTVEGYLADRPQRAEDGIDVLPVATFLAALDERRLW